VAKRVSRFLVVFTLAALVAGPASAREVRVLARMGLDGGGTRLAKVTMTDGSTQSLSAGGLFTIAAGLLFAPASTPIAVEATVGYKVDDVTASNGQLKFDRWPLELLASYRIDRHRLGGGVTRHGAPTYEIAVDGSPTSRVEFDDAVGAIVQYAYGDVSGNLYWDVGARLTFIEYRAPGDSVSGNSIGAFVSLGF
jgi:hypothetical protein